MIGFVDMGGGMRGIYGAGVADCFLENDINFDYCIGVSAGSANIASFLAGQKGRNYKFNQCWFTSSNLGIAANDSVFSMFFISVYGYY